MEKFDVVCNHMILSHDEMNLTLETNPAEEINCPSTRAMS